MLKGRRPAYMIYLNVARSKGFTLIELLVVIAILGILAAIVLIAVDPATQMARARDSERRTAMNSLSTALDTYYLVHGKYPPETQCDSSIGTSGSMCPPSSPQSGWNTSSDFYQAMMNSGIVKSMPVDPINDGVYYYRYEPKTRTSGGCGPGLCWYWIGARLEVPEGNKNVYRCTNNQFALEGPEGCLAVEADLDNFEDDPAPP